MGREPKEGLEALKGFVSLIIDNLEIVLEALREGVGDVAGFREEFAFHFTFFIYSDIADYLAVMANEGCWYDEEAVVVVVESMHIVVVFGVLLEERAESSDTLDEGEGKEPAGCIDIIHFVGWTERTCKEVVEE